MSASKKKQLDTDAFATELTGSAFFQPTSPQANKTTSTHVDKPTKPQVDKYTTHLRPASIEYIKDYARKLRMKDYEIVQQAIDEYEARHPLP